MLPTLQDYGNLRNLVLLISAPCGDWPLKPLVRVALAEYLARPSTEAFETFMASNGVVITAAHQFAGCTALEAGVR